MSLASKCPADWVSATFALLKSLQFFAGLESHCFSRRNGDLGPGARIPSDACLAWSNVEDTEAAKFNAISLGQGLLHRLEYSLNSFLGIRFGDASPVYDLIDDVKLYQVSSA
jgi:hypothetical protein